MSAHYTIIEDCEIERLNYITTTTTLFAHALRRSFPFSSSASKEKKKMFSTNDKRREKEEEEKYLFNIYTSHHIDKNRVLEK